jgi:hypothetical protein
MRAGAKVLGVVITLVSIGLYPDDTFMGQIYTLLLNQENRKEIYNKLITYEFNNILILGLIVGQ